MSSTQADPKPFVVPEVKDEEFPMFTSRNIQPSPLIDGLSKQCNRSTEEYPVVLVLEQEKYHITLTGQCIPVPDNRVHTYTGIDLLEIINNSADGTSIRIAAADVEINALLDECEAELKRKKDAVSALFAETANSQLRLYKMMANIMDSKMEESAERKLGKKRAGRSSNEAEDLE